MRGHPAWKFAKRDWPLLLNVNCEPELNSFQLACAKGAHALYHPLAPWWPSALARRHVSSSAGAESKMACSRAASGLQVIDAGGVSLFLAALLLAHGS